MYHIPLQVELILLRFRVEFTTFSYEVTICENFNGHNMFSAEKCFKFTEVCPPTFFRYIIRFDWMPINLICKNLDGRTRIHIFRTFKKFLINK